MPYLKLGSGPENKVKVACAPCIRGHRASSCDHINCLLIEVKRPGRPQVNHVSLPLNQHPCKDGEARTWTVNNKLQHKSEEFKANAKNHTFQPDEITAAGAQPYPKPKAKKNGARRKTLTSSPEETANAESIPESGSNGHFASFKAHLSPSRTPSDADAKPVGSCCGGSASLQHQSNLPEFSSAQASHLQLHGQFAFSHQSSNGSSTNGTLPPQRLQSYGRPSVKAEDQAPFTFHQHSFSRPAFSDSNSSLYHSPTNTSASTPFTPSTLLLPDDLTLLSPIQPSASGDIPQEHLTDDSRCICGTSCNCLGCPQHPHNPRTTAHINSINHYMSTDPDYNPESYLEARRQARQRLLIMCPDQVINLDEETDWNEINMLYTQFASFDSQAPTPHDGTTPENITYGHSYSATFHDELAGQAPFSASDGSLGLGPFFPPISSQQTSLSQAMLHDIPVTLSPSTNDWFANDHTSPQTHEWIDLTASGESSQNQAGSTGRSCCH